MLLKLNLIKNYLQKIHIYIKVLAIYNTIMARHKKYIYEYFNMYYIAKILIYLKIFFLQISVTMHI